MKKNVFFAVFAVIIAVNLLTACSDNGLDSSISLKQMQIDVKAPGTPESRALIEDRYLPDGSEIGVALFATNGNAYDGQDYNNIKYTATGEGNSQTWAGSDILLSATLGDVYAYYPYSSSVTNIEAIPVSTANQIDYMYATKVGGVSVTMPTVSLGMNHALSAIRFVLKRGNYTGTGAIGMVSVTSDAAATSATMNAKTGALNSIGGKGTEIAISPNFALTSEGKNADVIVVPTATNAPLTLKINVDGNSYSAITSALTLESGKVYTYTITVNAGNLSLSNVTVGNWTYNALGNLEMELGYKITIGGDLSGIALSNTENNGVVTIKAVPEESYALVKSPVITGANLPRTLNDETGVYTITISDLQSDVTISFNGITGQSNGVYPVNPYGRILPDLDACSENCIAVALVVNDAPTSQRFMIEKLGYANTTYANTNANLEEPYNKYFVWGGHRTNQSLKDYAFAYGSSVWGYLPTISGYYEGSQNQIPGDYTTWVGNYALADFDGKLNSEVIKNVTSVGDSPSVYATMGSLLNNFNKSDNQENRGYTDWYIPSFGQLALMYMYSIKIDEALEAISGSIMDVEEWDNTFLNSTELSTDEIFYITFNNGYIDYTTKDDSYRIRFIRDF